MLVDGSRLRGESSKRDLGSGSVGLVVLGHELGHDPNLQDINKYLAATRRNRRYTPSSVRRALGVPILSRCKRALGYADCREVVEVGRQGARAGEREQKLYQLRAPTVGPLDALMSPAVRVARGAGYRTWGYLQVKTRYMCGGGRPNIYHGDMCGRRDIYRAYARGRPQKRH